MCSVLRLLIMLPRDCLTIKNCVYWLRMLLTYHHTFYLCHCVIQKLFWQMRTYTRVFKKVVNRLKYIKYIVAYIIIYRSCLNVILCMYISAAALLTVNLLVATIEVA